MNFLNRRILYLDLNKKSFEIKTYPDLHQYLGGLALGLKLVEINRESTPLVFCIGPLSGLFPFVSKTCILECYGQEKGGLNEFYLGGSLSSRIKFAGFDAIVIRGRLSEPSFLEINPSEINFHKDEENFLDAGLPGRSSKIILKEKLLLDDYFQTYDDILSKSFRVRNIAGMLVNGTASFDLKAGSSYEKLHTSILEKTDKLSVLPGDNPSCIGCPMGCEKSKVGEVEGNVFVHTLVACQFASDIYSDLGVVFSCLNALGYQYTHEELEKIPNLIKSLMEDLR